MRKQYELMRSMCVSVLTQQNLQFIDDEKSLTQSLLLWRYQPKKSVSASHSVGFSVACHSMKTSFLFSFISSRGVVGRGGSFASGLSLSVKRFNEGKCFSTRVLNLPNYSAFLSSHFQKKPLPLSTVFMSIVLSSFLDSDGSMATSRLVCVCSM